MKSKAMTLERFVQLAHAWGGQIERWPAHEREAAYGLLARDQRADKALIDATALDQWLLPAAAPAVDLRRRILGDADKHLRPPPSFFRRLWLELGGIHLVAPALAGSLLLAFALVQLEPVGSVDSEDGELLNLALLSVEDEEYLP